jgi:3',5'-cyclic AMP phosphodiesterase CpdA
MIHHPPIRGATSMHKRMLGIRRFAATISAGGAELVLHGHTHLNTVYSLKGQVKPVPVVGIASASQGRGSRKPPAGFNLFFISGSPGQWNLIRERFELTMDGRSVTLVETTRF